MFGEVARSAITAGVAPAVGTPRFWRRDTVLGGRNRAGSVGAARPDTSGWAVTGPPKMVDDIADALTAMGADPDAITFEE